MNVKGTYLYIMFNEFEKKKLQFVSKKMNFSVFIFFRSAESIFNALLYFEFQKNTTIVTIQRN